MPQVHERLVVRVVAAESFLTSSVGPSGSRTQVLRVLFLVLVRARTAAVRVVEQVVLAFLARHIHGQQLVLGSR